MDVLVALVVNKVVDVALDVVVLGEILARGGCVLDERLALADSGTALFRLPALTALQQLDSIHSAYPGKYSQD